MWMELKLNLKRNWKELKRLRGRLTQEVTPNLQLHEYEGLCCKDLVEP